MSSIDSSRRPDQTSPARLPIARNATFVSGCAGISPRMPIPPEMT